MNSGGGRDGDRIQAARLIDLGKSVTQLKSCKDASKNDGGWLVGDLRCVDVIYDKVLRTDRRTDGQTLL